MRSFDAQLRTNPTMLHITGNFSGTHIGRNDVPIHVNNADPTITITTPASGAFTKSPLVRATVTGTGTLAVTMNGVTATLDPNLPDSFSAEVPLTTQDPLVPSNSTVIVALGVQLAAGAEELAAVQLDDPLHVRRPWRLRAEPRVEEVGELALERGVEAALEADGR